MNMLLQQLLAGALVIACALFSAWRLSSIALRLRALALLSAWPGLRGRSWLARLRERTLARQQQACGACGAKPTPGGKARNRTPDALRR